jgi:hypothetical protein
MHTPETKKEREVKCYATNQVHKNQSIGLNLIADKGAGIHTGSVLSRITH